MKYADYVQQIEKAYPQKPAGWAAQELDKCLANADVDCSDTDGVEAVLNEAFGICPDEKVLRLRKLNNEAFNYMITLLEIKNEMARLNGGLGDTLEGALVDLESALNEISSSID